MPIAIDYMDKITRPSDGKVFELRDTLAREQLALKKVVYAPDTLPVIADMTAEDRERALRGVFMVYPLRPENIAAGVVREVYVMVNTSSDPANPVYEWGYIGTTDTDLAGFSSKGHTHEVVPEVDVNDHSFQPSGTFQGSFTGSSGTTNGAGGHSHNLQNISKQKLSTVKIKTEAATLTLTLESNVQRATGELQDSSAAWDTDTLFNDFDVVNGTVVFNKKKMKTASTLSGVAVGTFDASKVTIGGSNSVERNMATGDLESGSQIVTDVGSQTSSVGDHTHTFVPEGGITGGVSINPINLKHKVNAHKVRTEPDQEDEGSHAFDWYGILFDKDDGDPVKPRVGNMDMHRTLPIQTKMARCLVKDDGTVYNWLDENDSRYYAPGSQDEYGNDISGRLAELTGTAHIDYYNSSSKTFNVQVKVRIPHHWRKVYSYLNGNKTMVKAMLSPYQQLGSGWVEVKEGFISAYEASIIGESLWSVSNITPKSGVELYTVQNGLPLCTCDIADAASYSAFMATAGHSQLPTSNVNLEGFRAAARKRNVVEGVADVRWNANVYDLYLAMLWLQVIEYANTDSQADFTTVPTAEGFKQGGLGVGCTTVYNWGDWGYQPFVPCGVTNILGNNSGEVLFALPQGLGGGTCRVNSYRGVELGHLWKITDAIKYVGTGSAQEVMRCADPANYGTNNGYVSIGTNCGSSGWKTDIMVGDDGDINCASVGGSSNRYWCDYNYTAVSEGAEYLCLLGGGASYSTIAGLACVYSDGGLSFADTYCGSRLCFYNA